METIASVFTDTYWSPYAVGIGIGILSWLSFLISGKPIATSTTFARIGGMIEEKIAGEKAEQRPYFKKIKLQINWQWMLIVGVVLGSFLSAIISGDFQVGVWVPSLWYSAFGDSAILRVIVALVGGIILGFGARFADGCTSGHGISGTLQLAVSSWVSAIFFLSGELLPPILFIMLLLNLQQVIMETKKQTVENTKETELIEEDKRPLFFGLGFGILFGFLLHKGGATKYDVIVGQLLLTDFTVLKIMLSAVATGMIGIYFMKSLGWIKLSIKSGSVGMNVIGALIFGVGFAVLGYCPGTIAGAVGNGYLDAITGGVAGIILGTWIFAVMYPRLKNGILKKGDFGKITIPRLLNVNDWVVVVPAGALIVLVLFWIEKAGF